MAVMDNKPGESKLLPESIAMYPTIVKDNNATLVIKTSAEKKYLYVITDMNGKTVAKKEILTWKGNNIVPVILPQLASGLYIITVFDGNVFKTSIKFVKG
jgi:hypothetical protein